MASNENYLILKLSDRKYPIPYNDRERLKKRAEGYTDEPGKIGGWKTSFVTIWKTTKALAIFRGQILAEYEIEDSIKLNREEKKVLLNLKEIKNSKYLDKVLDYKTTNPCSVLNTKDFQYK